MSTKEYELFLAFVRNSRNYVEFGSGGSTFLASRHVKNSIISVDSSREWLDKVVAQCAASPIQPKMVHVDIGTTGNWGFPTNPATKPSWPAYNQNIWDAEGSGDGDLYMIDGRFRVACFAQTVLHCRWNALICFHDFASRKEYHCIKAIAHEVATSEDLSIFRPMMGAQDAANSLVQAYKFDPA